MSLRLDTLLPMNCHLAPKLVLLPGDKAEDLEGLAELYEAMTGKKPTDQEMEEARRILDE